MIQTVAEAAIAVMLVAAGVFGLSGSIGLVKLPSPMMRLHSPTKATTLGVGGVLIASVINSWAIEGRQTWHEILVTLFLLLTAPITANFIAKAHLHRNRAREGALPPTGSDRTWATFEDEGLSVLPEMTQVDPHEQPRDVRTPG